MGAELRVDGGRVVALSRVVAEAGVSLDPESLRAVGARVSAGLPGARLASAAVTACADLGEAVGRLAAACAGWEQDVAAALASLSEVDDDAAADLRSQFGRGRQRAL